MADTAKRLSGPALLTASAATVYTVPASTTTILRNIHINNVTATAATVTISIGANATGTQIFSALTVGAASVVDWTGFIVLNAADTLQALSGTASALNLVICGVEVT